MFGGLPGLEINDLQEYWEAFPNLKTAILEKISGDYYKIIAKDIKNEVKAHSSVQEFEKNFKYAFSNFDEYLYDKLITKMDTLAILMAKENISLDIFTRLKNIPLIDKYEAYQLLDDDWIKIAVDLEIIQTEGFEATKVVDPNMLVKRKEILSKKYKKAGKGVLFLLNLYKTPYF